MRLDSHASSVEMHECPPSNDHGGGLGAGKVEFSMCTLKLPSYEQQGAVISCSCVLGKGLHLFAHATAGWIR